MKRRIITFGRYFGEFMEGLTVKEREKRVFFIFDEGKIVVLFNGFQKKSQKTPAGEITKALKIKEEYYEYKRNNDSGL